jgi:hypothetical protein
MYLPLVQQTAYLSISHLQVRASVWLSVWVSVRVASAGTGTEADGDPVLVPIRLFPVVPGGGVSVTQSHPFHCRSRRGYW